MKLMIVEDNFHMRRLIRGLVKDIAESITECVDGEDALSAYSRFQPDWVLMDIRMERVDGLTATRDIRDAFPEAKIVIVTNYDDAKFREKAKESGASYYVAKESLMEIRAILLQKDAAGNLAL